MACLVETASPGRLGQHSSVRFSIGFLIASVDTYMHYYCAMTELSQCSGVKRAYEHNPSRSHPSRDKVKLVTRLGVTSIYMYIYSHKPWHNSHTVPVRW